MNDVQPTLVPAVTVGDGFGIVYHIQTAQEFWSELEDILRLPGNEFQTLTLLDAALRRFLALCSAYHEQYLQSPLQLEHAVELLLGSELLEFHSERMSEIIVEDTQSTTDPHSQFVSYNVLYWIGKRKPEFFRANKRWKPLLPLLMDHVVVDIDPDVEDNYTGIAEGSNGLLSVPVPIEAKLRTVGVKLLYELCKMQKFTLNDLKTFDDGFIDTLFDLVESTRNMQDDTFNYSIIKLIVSLNEQFMVATLPTSPTISHGQNPEDKNRVLRVLMRRLGFSRTFGENMIFMLNRARQTAEDLCMQLLILKMLYLLFTTPGTSEYFYTNDLCVLVDVFLRELMDLDEDSESLRHNYLRVLHPLLTRTQLRDYPYKRPQILYVLESLMSHSKIRDINPTTKRLVERCLSGDWSVQLRARRDAESIASSDSASETSNSAISSQPRAHPLTMQLERSNSLSKHRVLKTSKSVENMKIRQDESHPPLPSLEKLRRISNINNSSLPAVGESKSGFNVPKRRDTATSAIDGTNYRLHDKTSHEMDRGFHTHHHQLLSPQGNSTSQPTQERITSSRSHSRPPPPPPVQTRTVDPPLSPRSTTSSVSSDQPQPRRRPPPAPPHRRKPPPIPIGRTNSGVTITVIRSSEAPPLMTSTTPNHTSSFQQSAIF